MANKLAILEVELEKQLLLEGRQGVVAGWYLDQMAQIEQQNKNEFVFELNNVAMKHQLTKEQQKAFLELFVQEMRSFTDISHKLASEVAHKLEGEAKHARHRLQL